MLQESFKAGKRGQIGIHILKIRLIHAAGAIHLPNVLKRNVVDGPRMKASESAPPAFALVSQAQVDLGRGFRAEIRVAGHCVQTILHEEHEGLGRVQLRERRRTAGGTQPAANGDLVIYIEFARQIASEIRKGLVETGWVVRARGRGNTSPSVGRLTKR